MLGYKTSLNTFKNIEIILGIFYDHNTMKLESNYKKKTAKNSKHAEAKPYTTKQSMNH